MKDQQPQSRPDAPVSDANATQTLTPDSLTKGLRRRERPRLRIKPPSNSHPHRHPQDHEEDRDSVHSSITGMTVKRFFISLLLAFATFMLAGIYAYEAKRRRTIIRFPDAKQNVAPESNTNP